MIRKMSIILILLLLNPVLVLAASQLCDTNIPESTPASRFSIDNSNGTVTDIETGLMWKKCSEGQTFNSSTGGCDDSALAYDWDVALQNVVSLNQGGGFASYTDWRLPNIKELDTIVEYRCDYPSINLTVFPATPASWYYISSTPDVSSGSTIWGVQFQWGNVDTTGKVGYGNRVRLVRGGQPTL